MDAYLALGKRILESGKLKLSRPGTPIYSLFGEQIRFNLQEGFPLVTTREMKYRGMIAELLWFLKGSTNALELEAMGAKFWNDWMLEEDISKLQILTNYERATLLAEKESIPVQEAVDKLNAMNAAEQYLFEKEIGAFSTKVIIPRGSLGPIYGKQWRDFNGVDQIKELIKNLKEIPLSRRHVISAWNPADLPDENFSPQENVKNGKMALAPCHVMFQFNAEVLSFEERHRYAFNTSPAYRAFLGISHDFDLARKYPIEECKSYSRQTAWLDLNNFPRYRLDCMLTQRSADYPVGSATNIASYSLLTLMVAQCVNMVPGDFVYSLGNVHVYTDQVDSFKEQCQRKPYPLPKMVINPDVKDIFCFTMDDFTLIDYQSHPAIKYNVAI